MKIHKLSLFERIAVFLIAAILFIIAVFPIYWILITSFKPVQDSVTVPIQYFPKHFTLQNYIDVVRLTSFLTYFRNSSIVAISTGVVTTFCAIFAAYSLSRFNFKLKNFTLLMFLITQMIPTLIMIVPLFVLFTHLGLTDNLLGLIIPYTVTAIPFCTVMLIGFFKQIPVTLEEAAMIDGCNKLSALFRIVIPVMMPGIISVFVFAFIAAWNELFFGVVFINDEKLKTIPVGISSFIQKVDVNWGMMTSAAVIAIIPVAILFIFIQKYLVQGLSAGAVKG